MPATTTSIVVMVTVTMHASTTGTMTSTIGMLMRAVMIMIATTVIDTTVIATIVIVAGIIVVIVMIAMWWWTRTPCGTCFVVITTGSRVVAIAVTIILAVSHCRGASLTDWTAASMISCRATPATSGARRVPMPCWLMSPAG